MWYLIANYNGKTYNLGAGFDNTMCVMLQNVYKGYVDKVEFKIECDSSIQYRPNYHTQRQFVTNYKIDHFMVAHLEMPDVTERFE